MAKELDDLTLYVRGMHQDPEEIEDVWDDTVLNNAYDKALKMANEEVAKRIAMETNSNKSGGSKNKSSKGKPEAKSKKETIKPETTKTEWKAGMPCRAIYDDDGLEYEAFLVRIIDEEDCIVKFLGYDNSERVPISSLKPTHGDQARLQQLDAAIAERDDDGFESQPASESVDLYSDAASSPGPADRSNNKKKKSNKKKNRSFEFGDLPTLPMPTMNMFRNMSGADMPLPPPPPLISHSDRSDAEEQAISDMLLSWYMTGYYTGLYQGMKRQRQGRRYQ